MYQLWFIKDVCFCLSVAETVIFFYLMTCEKRCFLLWPIIMSDYSCSRNICIAFAHLLKSLLRYTSTQICERVKSFGCFWEFFFPSLDVSITSFKLQYLAFASHTQSYCNLNYLLVCLEPRIQSWSWDPDSNHPGVFLLQLQDMIDPLIAFSALRYCYFTPVFMLRSAASQ